MSNKPVFKAKVGSVEVSVWENQGEDYTNFSFGPPTKSYKDKEGNWKTTTNIRSTEALNAIVAYQKCFEFVYLKNDESETNESPI